VGSGGEGKKKERGGRGREGKILQRNGLEVRPRKTILGDQGARTRREILASKRPYEGVNPEGKRQV